MNCMKCGRETDANQIFCGECLAEMEKYPVKPGVVVQIPTQIEKKQAHHRRAIVTTEEQVRRLKKRNHGLILTMILLAAVTVFLAMLSFKLLEESGMNKILGQNYSVAVSTEATTETIARSPLH